MNPSSNTQSDLQALRKLYGLITNGEGGTSNAAAIALDDHARLLLKNMLDKETQRMLIASEEIIQSQIEVSKIISPDESSKKKPTPPPYSAKNMAQTKSCKTDMGSEQERKLEYSDSTLGIYTPPQGIQAGFQEQGTWSMGELGAENRRKRCRVCQRVTSKKSEAIEQKKSSAAAQNPYRFMDLQNKQNKQLDIPLWNSKQETESIVSNERDDSTIEGKKKTETNCLSEEASEAIKAIELCISALQVGAALRLSEENSAKNQEFVPDEYNRTNLPCSSQSESSPLVQPTKNCPHLSTDPFIRNIDPASRSDVSRLVRSQNIWAIVERTESGNWTMNRMGCPDPKHGNLNASKDQNERFSTFSSALEMGDRDKVFTAIKEKSNLHEGIQTHEPFKSILNPIHRGNHHSNHCVALRDDNCIQVLPDLKQKGRVSNSRKYVTPHKASYQQEESESTASSSYSSNWESSEYSSPDSARRLHYATTPSTSTESGNYVSDIEKDNEEEDEVYSSTSGDGAYESASESSSINSKRYEYSSSYDQPNRHRLSTVRPNKSEKPVGTWKRMKDKLTVIFHHHHHHHHHHHFNGDDGNQDFHQMIRNISLKKHRGKSVRSDEVEAYGEKAIEKIKKSAMARQKNQRSQFQGLVKGFMNHVRPSKKSVPVLHKHSKQNVSKKTDLWKLLKHHKGAKLPKKAPVKLGLGEKKTGVKALPKLKSI